MNSKVIEKAQFGKNYLTIEHGDKLVVLYPDTGRSTALSWEQYQIFGQMQEKAGDREELIRYVTEDEGKYKLLLHLLEKGLITLKPVEETGKLKTRHYAAYWGLTDSCNFQCLYCYANAGAIRKCCETSSDLSIEECYRVVDIVLEKGFHELVLTGGEPLLEKKVFAIGAYAKEKGMLVGLLTNGSLVTRHTAEEFKNSFNYIKISLDSAVKEHNDKVRGAGTYERILEGIQFLVDNEIPVTMGSVLTKYNVDDIDETLRMAYERFGVTDYQVINHIPIGRGTDSQLGCDFDTLKRCDDQILRTKQELLGDRMFSIIQDGFIINGRKVCCGLGSSEIFINAKGDVYPCRMTYTEEYRLGNLLEEDLDVVLDRMSDIQEKIHVDQLEDCKDCEYKYVCGGGCRMYHAGFSGSMFKNDPNVCAAIKRQCRDMILLQNGIDPLA